MNSNWYLYRNFVRPVLVKAATVLFTACIEHERQSPDRYHGLCPGRGFGMSDRVSSGLYLGEYPCDAADPSDPQVRRNVPHGNGSLFRLRGRGTGGGSVYRIYKGDGGESRKEDRVLCGIREG